MLHVSKRCRFLIENGRYIFIDRGAAPGQVEQINVSDARIRLLILGTAMGVLLHQRGMVPLHLSSVSCPRGVFGFSGVSGDGKSTLAALMHSDYKCGMFSDDVAAFDPNCEQTVLKPGPRRLKLWDDALAHLEVSNLGRVQDLENQPKYQLLLNDVSQIQEALLEGLIMLERVKPGEKPCLTRLQGVEAFSALMGAVYRLNLGLQIHGNLRLMEIVCHLSRTVDIYLFRRRWDLKYLKQDVGIILSLFGLESAENSGSQEASLVSPGRSE